MQTMSLKEYIESRPIKKNSPITTLHSCSLCGKLLHITNIAFIMAEKKEGYGSFSFILCSECLPQWKQYFHKRRISSSFDEWNFSTWDLDKPTPHTEIDRILLHIKRNQLYLQADYNPSRRERNMIKEEIR